MTYTPTPIDTSGVYLAREIVELTERLAENSHEHWAARRIAEGWSYGPTRDDAAMRHPCLVPYDQLPDSEKEYDRASAMETLMAVIALGFKIDGPRDAAP